MKNRSNPNFFFAEKHVAYMTFQIEGLKVVYSVLYTPTPHIFH